MFMSEVDVLDDVWLTYQTTVDSLNVVMRSVLKGNISALEKTNFIGESETEVLKKIRESREHADDYVIMALWTVFERVLFQHVQNESKRLQGNNVEKFTQAVYEKFENECEYWRVDVLNLFKVVIDPNLIGNAKQVKKYRDWVAHKNIKKGQPQNVPPIVAYKVLSEIIKQLKVLM